jgi:hypothetical protein
LGAEPLLASMGVCPGATGRHVREDWGNPPVRGPLRRRNTQFPSPSLRSGKACRCEGWSNRTQIQAPPRTKARDQEAGEHRQIGTRRRHPKARAPWVLRSCGTGAIIQSGKACGFRAALQERE